MPLPRRFTHQVIDHRSRAHLGAIWREANAAILRLSAEHSAVVVIDLDPLLAESVPASDLRQSIYAKAHLSPELLSCYAREIGHLARHLSGRTKKCLVLDLDNTMWGGVLGDDGPDGIEVADSYRGEAFRAFQRVVKQIGSQGVLLVVASKNNIEPVREVLREHPRMTLREEDFVLVVANWRPKHDNLQDVAQALNIGLDSLVFVDDSSYECGLVRHALPDVTVVQLDSEPALHLDKLLRDGWFDVRDLTSEDRGRVGQYREELVRADFLNSFDSIDGYLRELGVSVRLTAVRKPDVARVSQLTLRTNQFNLTTQRLQPPEIQALVDDPAAWTLAIHSRDRFGDNGLVGAVLAHRDGDTLHIDNFLLSCRVFARGIEGSCLGAVLRRARDTGVGEVFATYRKTAKNAIVEAFYPRHGFERVTDDGTTVRFRHTLAEIATAPQHLHLTEDL